MSLRERLYRFRSFWVFPLAAMGLIYVAFRGDPGSLKNFLWLFPMGLAAWTLIEYGLHRFVFHITCRSPRLSEILNASHIEHHRAPRNPDRLFVHLNYSLVISTLLFGGLYAAFGRMDFSAGMLCGIWAGFLYYEAVHYRSHLTSAATGLIGRQRRAHFYHHFTNNARCFGVTTPLWDFVFRTQLPRAGR